MRKRLRTVMFGIGLMILLAQPAFAEELGQANITPDMTMQEIRSDPVMRESGAVYECHVYEDAPHAIGPGRHTDADGWILQATEFWEKQCK